MDVDQEFIDPKSETIYECSIVKMKSSGTQYDYFWAGGSEFKIQVIRPESIYGDTTMTSVAFELTRKKIKNESSINLDVKIHGDWKSGCGNVYVHFSEEDWGNGTMSIPINFSYSGFSISTTLGVSNNDDIIFSDQIMRDNLKIGKFCDEYFSENQLIYLDDDWSGFSDFSIVGDNYTESGFSPKVVAIHMVYFSDDNILRIHHFLSQNDESIENIPGKFNEALTELLSFSYFTQENNKSFALLQFEELKKQEKFPGLGTVKKLSVMHHLELMSNFLR